MQRVFLSFLFIGLYLFAMQSQASLEAVELELVPSNIKTDCNRSFFKSSLGKSRSLYVTPHVVAGRTPISGNKREVHIRTTPVPGKYVMNVGVFFPRDAEDATNSYELLDAQANFCNFESVLYWINEGKSEGEKFDRIEHLPLTSIEVSIAGLNLPGHIIGRVAHKENAEADILEYNDRSYTAQFVIDDNDLDYINERLNRDSGLQLNVKYSFQARRKDGSVEVFVDAEEVSSHFLAAAKGKKYMVKADLEAALRSAVSKSDVRVNEKAGSSSDLQSISSKIIDKVLASVKFDSVLPEVTAEPPQVAETENQINVAAVAKYLSTKLSRSFSYNRTTTPSKTTAETSVRIFSRPIDPRVQEVELRDGFSPEVFPTQIKAGQTIKITPGYHFVARREWATKTSYLTMSQLQPLGVTNNFPEITNSKMVITNKVVNGHLRAVGDWWRLYYLESFLDPIYQWKRLQRFPVKVHRTKVRRFNLKGAEDLSRVPVLFSFSRIGASYHMYDLAELLEEKEKWTAEFKESSIVLTAKEDLGVMTVRETMSINKPYYDNKEDGRYIYRFKADQEDMDVVIQEFHWGSGIGGGKEDNGRMVVRNRVDKWAIKMYKAVVLAITGPSSLAEQPATEEIQQDIQADALNPAH